MTKKIHIEDRQPPAEWFGVNEEVHGVYTDAFKQLEGGVEMWMSAYQQGNQELLKGVQQSAWNDGDASRPPTIETINRAVEAEQGIKRVTSFTPARLEIARICTGESPSDGLNESVFLESIMANDGLNPTAKGARVVMNGYRGEDTRAFNSLQREMDEPISYFQATVVVEATNQNGGTFTLEIQRGDKLKTHQTGYFGSSLDFKGNQPVVDKRLGMAGRPVSNLLGDVRELMSTLEP